MPTKKKQEEFNLQNLATLVAEGHSLYQISQMYAHLGMYYDLPTMTLCGVPIGTGEPKITAAITKEAIEDPSFADYISSMKPQLVEQLEPGGGPHVLHVSTHEQAAAQEVVFNVGSIRKGK